ncbi:Gaa1-like protein [Clavulina sp. PMI_390]|nr:Gaa1-like protein [Clavulina sp. PMI_390]
MPGDEWAKAQRSRLSRRRALQKRLFDWSWTIRLAFCFAGLVWMVLIPTSLFVKEVWVDENALQPNSVNTHWDWPNVHKADYYLETMESMRDRNATRDELTAFIMDEFRRIGLPSATQSYEIIDPSQSHQGTNVYAYLSAPRATAAEAIIVSASWQSMVFEDQAKGLRRVNWRAIAMLLAVARQYKAHSYWAKDLIFVISDGYLDGMHAFLSSYHGATDSPGLRVDPLMPIPRGVVWAALCLDYSGHSFSELGIFYEGANGRLPNQDLINSLSTIGRWTANIPIILYDRHPDEVAARIIGAFPDAFPWNLLKNTQGSLKWEWLRKYITRSAHVLRHVGYQASGTPSGVHGLFHQYRIDAVTLFAVPAHGPHGFYALGKMLESSMRTINNLLERLHASFFFYLFTSPDEFIVIGMYLPSAVLIGIGLELNGLYGWVASGWRPGARREDGITARLQRPVVEVLAIMGVVGVAGAAAAGVLARFPDWIITRMGSFIAFAVLTYLIPLLMGLILSSSVTLPVPRIQPLLNSLTLCIAGTVVCIVSVLNFSLAAGLAVSFVLVLPFNPVPVARPNSPNAVSSASTSSDSKPRTDSNLTFALKNSPLAQRIVAYTVTSLFAPPSIALLVAALNGGDWTPVRAFLMQEVWEWNVLGAWSMPFVCCVYWVVIMLAGVGKLLY